MTTLYKSILFIVFCYVKIVAFSQSDTLVLHDKNDTYYPLPYMALYIDDTNSFTIKDAIEQNDTNWFVLSEPVVTFGYSPETYWFRLYIKNNSTQKQRWIFSIDYPHLDNITLFKISNGIIRIIDNQGDTYPFSNKKFRNNGFDFTLPPDSNQISTFYLSVKSSGSIELPMLIRTTVAYQNDVTYHNLFHGVIYGLFLFIIIYSLLLVFVFKQKVYWYYTAFVLSIAFIVAVLNGHAFMFLWPQTPEYNDTLLPFAVVFGTLWSVLYSRAIMNIRRLSHKLTLFTNFYLMIISLLLIAPWFLDYSTIIRIAIGNIIFVSIIQFTIGLYALKSGYRYASNYAIGWSLFSIATVIYSFKSLGILPVTFITVHSLEFGALTTVVMVYFAMRYRWKLLEAETDEANKKTLELQKEQNVKLERLVNARTESLEEALTRSQEREDEITQLNTLMQTVNATLDIDTILPVIFAALNSIIKIDGFSILILDEEADCLKYYKAYGEQLNDDIHDKFKQLPVIPLYTNKSVSIQEKVISKQKMLVIPNIPDPNSFLSFDKEIYDIQPFKSVIIVPMMIRKKIIGTISLVGIENELHPDNHTLKKAESYIAHLAAAIHNAINFQYVNQINNIILKQKDRLTQALIELQKANDTKDKFFSIIAHDLRSPFQALISLADILREDYHNLDDSTRIESLQQIYSASKKVFTLLENLLDWSRAQTGRLKLRKHSYDINTLITETIQLLSSNSNSKNLIIEAVTDSDTIVYADSQTVSAILRNLISNAIKFSHRNSTITITTENIDSFVRVSVSDTGIGMDSQKVASLFKIARNFSSPGTENEKGTGLGLLVCKEFVELNGGKIYVKSSPNAGSTFSFSLPKPK